MLDVECVDVMKSVIFAMPIKSSQLYKYVVRMKTSFFTFGTFLLLLTGMVSCKDKASTDTIAQSREVVPTVCVYTLGDVSKKLQYAMMDSLQARYPKCKMAGNIPLPVKARTTQRNDHVRYRADILNNVLSGYKTDSTLVIGITQADIGLDNFRGRAHSGIMGLASGIGTGVAVFSSYRPRGNAQLFSVMLHEIGHAQGLRHCTDTQCLMQNAKGGNPFSKTNVFCNKCKSYMKSKQWKL